jgi:hypothetical protein
METFNRYLIVAHVAGGLFALGLAPIAMATRKGGKWHVTWGRIYFWTMMWVTASALVLSCTKRFVFFLVGVTVLGFYDTFTGVRCLYRKNAVAANARGTSLDWAVTAGASVFAVVMAAQALLNWRPNSVVPMLGVIFAVLILNETLQDTWRFFRPSTDPKWWWYYHMERMLGSWVAGVTALAVNQIGPRVPASYRIWVWLGPAMVIVPIITLWVRYYRKKFTSRAPTVSAAVPATG